MKTAVRSITIVLLVMNGVVSAQGFGRNFGRDPATLAAAKAQTTAATGQMHAYLNDISFKALSQRSAQHEAIKTKAQAISRRDAVRELIVRLVGGLPVTTGPVRVKAYDTVQDDGFTIENIAYESCPDYWVTANVYVPGTRGPFPAMIIAPGHGAGKSSQYYWAANFARAGILVLSIDPMGQGERMQHWDHELGRSKLEGSGDHEHANQTALLIGHHVARYWFADGIRGTDYLVARPDVVQDRIGTFGCSGGGTAAAYLAAMEPRIHAVAVSSFLTSFRELLPGNGPQDAEQTLPGFISNGLDFADWVELAAPRPYAIIAFQDDFFPIDGAKRTFDEAKRIYELYGEEGNIQLIQGQGGHCNLGPVTDELIAFFRKTLLDGRTPITGFQRLRLDQPNKLIVTPTGQVSTSVNSRSVEDIARLDSKIFPINARVISDRASLDELQQQVRADLRQLAAIEADETQLPKVTSGAIKKAEGYRVEPLEIESEPGIILQAAIGLPDVESTNRVIIWLDPAPITIVTEQPEFARLVRAGNHVLALHPRDVLGEPQEGPEQLALGQYMPELLRAIVVGKTIVGMRVDDIERAINWIVSRPDLNSKQITLYAKGGLGMAAIHLAALDERVDRLILENSLLSYHTALEAGLHKNLSEVVIPKVLTRYDTPQLMQAIFPRRINLINPANAMGQELRRRDAEQSLSAVIQSDQALGQPDRMRILHRNFGDPLQID